MKFNKKLKLYSVPLYLMIGCDNIFGRIIIKEIGRVIVLKKHREVIDYSTGNKYRIVPEVAVNKWGEIYINPPKWFNRSDINTYFFVDRNNFDECHLASAEEVVNYLSNPNPNLIEIYGKNLVSISPEQQYVNKITGRI